MKHYFKCPPVHFMVEFNCFYGNNLPCQGTTFSFVIENLLWVQKIKVVFYGVFSIYWGIFSLQVFRNQHWECAYYCRLICRSDRGSCSIKVSSVSDSLCLGTNQCRLKGYLIQQNLFMSPVTNPVSVKCSQVQSVVSVLRSCTVKLNESRNNLQYNCFAVSLLGARKGRPCASQLLFS